MKTRKVLSTKDGAFETCGNRVRILRDESPGWPPDEWPLPFLRWSRRGDVSGDREAECPFLTEADGDVTVGGDGRPILRDGIVAFGITMHDHSGRTFYLSDGSAPCSGDRWDVSRDVCWVYTDASMWGSGWNPDDPAFRERVRGKAEEYVRMMNLQERGEFWSWVQELKLDYVKTYSNGDRYEGCDWNVVNCGDGYLTDDVNEIGFPLDEDVTVFSDDFAGAEYRVPEFVVCKREADGSYVYLMSADDRTWTANPREALTNPYLGETYGIARDVLGKDCEVEKHVIELDEIEG